MNSVSSARSPRTHQRSFSQTPQPSTSTSNHSSSDSDEDSTSRSQPRASSPISSRSKNAGTMRKLVAASRWIQSSYHHPHSGNDLDFGCAGNGDWTAAEGADDLGDRFYSSVPGGHKRSSTSSSIFIPSLTHSRAHSASSDFSSVSTVDSSLPPSPTQGSCAVLTPLSPYTSRVPLTPRSSQRKRQCDEVAAIDAVNEYFHRVRLSQIEEDDSTGATSATSSRESVSARTLKGNDGLEGLGIQRLSSSTIESRRSRSLSMGSLGKRASTEKRQHNRSVSSGVTLDPDFAVEFAYLAPGFSTFTPLEEEDQVCELTSSPSCSSSGESTVSARTPPIAVSSDEEASTLEGELDELSAFFCHPGQYCTSDKDSSPGLGGDGFDCSRKTSLRQVASLRKRPNTTFGSQSAIHIGATPSPRTRIDYTWI